MGHKTGFAIVSIGQKQVDKHSTRFLTEIVIDIRRNLRTQLLYFSFQIVSLFAKGLSFSFFLI